MAAGWKQPAGTPSLTRSWRQAMTNTPTSEPTRAERRWLATTALRAVLTGAARAVTTWLLDEHIHF
jgi:hypothetical protein